MPKREREKRKESKKKKKKLSLIDGLDLGYSNESNPFGDSNLTEQFVWKKKEETASKTDKKSKSKKKPKAIQKELEKARKRREEREREKRLWEEQMSLLDRQRNQQESEDWQARELSFHLIQAKRRSEIRIREGRAKSIDWLYQWVMLGYSHDRDAEHEKQKLLPVYNPYFLIADLTMEQLKELVEDIKVILSTKNDYTETYETLLTLCEYEIDKSKGAQDVVKALQDLGVEELFIDKSSKELSELQGEIRNTLNSGGAIDVSYWETLLKASHIIKARSLLTEKHSQILEKRAELFDDNELPQDLLPTWNKESNPTVSKQHHGEINTQEENKNMTEEQMKTKMNKKRLEILEKSAEQLYKRSKSNHDDTPTTEDIMFRRESEKGLDENEEVFSSEVDIVGEEYTWNDVYRPRKPKYYNRVKTGYEWNKYNQTHYDQDNPPPKIIQGYQFNVFYPDLINPRKSPSFHVQKTDDETTIIRFHAGPPYEDIAFRIVNKEWEISHRKGYKCVFERGVLQLWFNFKRYRYRR